jgi:hypothetical protein
LSSQHEVQIFGLLSAFTSFGARCEAFRHV